MMLAVKRRKRSKQELLALTDDEAREAARADLLAKEIEQLASAVTEKARELRIIVTKGDGHG